MDEMRVGTKEKNLNEGINHHQELLREFDMSDDSSGEEEFTDDHFHRLSQLLAGMEGGIGTEYRGNVGMHTATQLLVGANLQENEEMPVLLSLPVIASPVLDENGSRRTMTGFMLFSNEWRLKIYAAYKVNKPTMKSISKVLGDAWNGMSPEDKMPYDAQAKEIRDECMRNYPNWKPQPRKKRKCRKRKQMNPRTEAVQAQASIPQRPSKLTVKRPVSSTMAVTQQPKQPRNASSCSSSDAQLQLHQVNAYQPLPNLHVQQFLQAHPFRQPQPAAVTELSERAACLAIILKAALAQGAVDIINMLREFVAQNIPTLPTQ